MWKGGSSLNPYATSYVPVSKRGAADKGNGVNPTYDLQSGNEAVWHGHTLDKTLTESCHQNVQSYTGRAGAVQTGEFAKLKNGTGGDFYASSSYNPHGSPRKSSEQYDTDMYYLQMSYPGISVGSLSDIYSASNYDLDAAMDMMDILEQPGDFSHKLPDTLDIGDVAESGPSNVSPSYKLKSPAAAGASASGSPYN